MKINIFLSAIVLVVILASAGHAQIISEDCQVSVDVRDSISGGKTTAEITYQFSCGATIDNDGQITRMLVSLPLTDIENLEAQDSFGTLQVLEGPSYTSLEKRVSETLVGVIFRKGLELDKKDTAYDITLRFESEQYVRSASEYKIFNPSKLVAKPKITFIGQGITETTMLIDTYNYYLEIPPTNALEEVSPAVCGIEGGVVRCEDISESEFDKLEVKLKITGEENIQDSVKNIASKLTDTFKKTTSRIKLLFNLL